MTILIGILIGLSTVFAASLQRIYAHVPLKELKRRARYGDQLAEALYMVATYGASLRAVLWTFMCISGAGFVVFMSLTTPIWLALITGGLLVWIGFIWLPALGTTDLGIKFAAIVAPIIAKILYYLHSPIDRILSILRRYHPIYFHTGIYERADLLDLIDSQQLQSDNRIENDELDIVRGALTFGDKIIRDIMTPRRVVNTVNSKDDAGPILMNELYTSGHSRFLVYDGKEDNIVGILFLRDLAGKNKRGKVKDYLHPEVMYLHEEQTLFDALQAIKKTHHHLYVVVNSFEEYVGIITLEDVLEQIIGSPVMDEFDQYEDMRAVAARVARVIQKERANEEEPKPESESESESEPAYKSPEADETIEVE